MTKPEISAIAPVLHRKECSRIGYVTIGLRLIPGDGQLGVRRVIPALSELPTIRELAAGHETQRDGRTGPTAQLEGDSEGAPHQTYDIFDAERRAFARAERHEHNSRAGAGQRVEHGRVPAVKAFPG